MRSIDCSERNPQRPVDWRWRRARTLHRQGGQPGRLTADRWTTRAWYFLGALRRRPDEAGRRRLAATMPGLSRAHRLWRRADDPMRWELEARLLTTDSPREIAARMGVPACQVVAYERVFYNVRPYLEASSYIVHHALDTVLVRGLSPRAIDALWKHVAYAAGPAALDAFIEPFAARRGQGSPEPDVPTLIAEVTKSLIERKWVVAAWTSHLSNPKDAIDLIKLGLRYPDYFSDERPERRKTGQPHFNENINVFIDEFVRVWPGLGARPAVGPVRGT